MLARREFIKVAGAIIGGAGLPVPSANASDIVAPKTYIIPNANPGIPPTKVLLTPSTLWDFDSAGNQYAMNVAEGTLEKFDINGHRLWQKGGMTVPDKKLLNVATSVYVTGDGKAYVADPGNSRVTVYSATGRLLKVLRPTQKARLVTPRDLAVAERKVFIADTLKHAIHIYGTDGLYRSSFGELGFRYDQLNGPVSIAVGAGSDIFVVDKGNAGIKVFSRAGALMDLFDGGRLGGIEDFRPSYIQMGPDDILYAADSIGGRVAVITQYGKLLDLIDLKLPDGSRAQPRYLAFDPDGTLVISALSALPPRA